MIVGGVEGLGELQHVEQEPEGVLHELWLVDAEAELKVSGGTPGPVGRAEPGPPRAAVVTGGWAADRFLWAVR